MMETLYPTFTTSNIIILDMDQEKKVLHKRPSYRLLYDQRTFYEKPSRYQNCLFHLNDATESTKMISYGKDKIFPLDRRRKKEKPQGFLSHFCQSASYEVEERVKVQSFSRQSEQKRTDCRIKSTQFEQAQDDDYSEEFGRQFWQDQSDRQILYLPLDDQQWQVREPNWQYSFDDQQQYFRTDGNPYQLVRNINQFQIVDGDLEKEDNSENRQGPSLNQVEITNNSINEVDKRQTYMHQIIQSSAEEDNQLHSSSFQMSQKSQCKEEIYLKNYFDGLNLSMYSEQSSLQIYSDERNCQQHDLQENPLNQYSSNNIDKNILSEQP